ncbi:hypothetical protein SPBRAN_974 [uncultured Candidatus Thioglobus sp.]|nr:hypothetical protein SPBRAN_974 [uncultured Candidatus Thioglobus sp.]
MDMVQTEEVIIRRRDGKSFAIIPKTIPNSAFDVAGIKTQTTKKDILAAISKSRK